MRFIHAIVATLIGRDAYTGGERQRTVGYTNNIGKTDIFCRLAQHVPPVAATLASQNSTFAKFEKYLLQKLSRDIRLFGDVRDHHGLIAAVLGENDERVQRVAAFLGEHLISDQSDRACRNFPKNQKETTLPSTIPNYRWSTAPSTTPRVQLLGVRTIDFKIQIEIYHEVISDDVAPTLAHELAKWVFCRDASTANESRAIARPPIG